jgi:hypothetical protein
MSEIGEAIQKGYGTNPSQSATYLYIEGKLIDVKAIRWMS